MAKKATHFGQCQACGNRQKLPGGVLSIHGYTVAQGFFEGTCQGTGHRPYEKAFDLIESFIKNAQKRKTFFLYEISRLEQKTDVAEVPIKVYKPENVFMKAGYHWDTREIISKDRDNGHGYTWTEFGYMTESRRNSKELEFVKVDTHAPRPTAEDVVRYLCVHKIKALRLQIEKVDEYIVWQEDRIKNWREMPLVEIK